MHSRTAIEATVVICSYNRAGPLRDALASLVAQNLPDHRAFEIVVVDDGSTDDTAQAVFNAQTCTSVPIRYVRVPHGGIAAARNAGVQQARGEWVAFFDDDQEADLNWLTALIRRAVDTGADCVAGRITVALTEAAKYGRLDSTVLKLLGDNSFMAAGSVLPSVTGPGIIPGTGNALVRRALFDRFGSFDERLAYGEDAEWFRRARRLGARIVFAPDAVIRHLTPPSRLAPDYLFMVAARGAASRAADDLKDSGTAMLVRNILLRAIHLCLTTVRLALARISGNHASSLGRKCSLRYSLTYIASAVSLLRRDTRATRPVVKPGYR